jgi:hypothetical protein
MTAAATVLAAVWRGSVVRRSMRRREAAAIVLARAWRRAMTDAQTSAIMPNRNKADEGCMKVILLKI